MYYNLSESVILKDVNIHQVRTTLFLHPKDSITVDTTREASTALRIIGHTASFRIYGENIPKSRRLLLQILLEAEMFSQDLSLAALSLMVDVGSNAPQNYQVKEENKDNDSGCRHASLAITIRLFIVNDFDSGGPYTRKAFAVFAFKASWTLTSRMSVVGYNCFTEKVSVYMKTVAQSHARNRQITYT